MDLNDPRRRIQIARNSNPSIRVSVAPKTSQNVKVTVDKTPSQKTVSVVPGGTPYAPAPPKVQFNAQKGLESLVDAPGGFVKGIADILNPVESFTGLSRGIAETMNFNSRAGQEARGSAERLQNQNIELTQRAAQKLRDPNTSPEERARWQKFVQTNTRQQRPQFLDQTAQNEEVVAATNPVEGAVNTVGTGFALGDAKGFTTAAKDIFRAVKGRLTGTKLTSVLSDADFESAAAAALKEAGVPEPTVNIAQPPAQPNFQVARTDAEFDKMAEEALKELKIDPNLQISDAARQRYQEEGIGGVEQGETPYGAQYQDGTVRFRDQSQVTDDNLYHELGHHVYLNKLTPEERALFANTNGPARKQAEGRPNYGPDELASEDFSDYMRMALTGKLNQVPESVRSVIAKYAKIAETEEPQAVQAIKSTAVDASLPAKGQPTNLGELAKGPGRPNELETMPELKGQADGAQPISAPVPAENVPANAAAKATPEANPAAAQAEAKLDEVSATHAGTDGITFRDPATGKNTKRPVEEVESELNDLKAKDELTTQEKKRVKQLETKIFKYRSQNAKYSFPDADPDTQQAIQAVMDELAGASRRYNVADKARSQERAQRISKGEGVYEQVGGGEAGFQAKLGSLKGEMTKSTYEPIAAKPEVQNKILDDIEKSNLRPFEKLNTQNAMRKIWGANPEKPTPSDINSIRKYFGDDMADAVQAAVELDPKNWKDRIVDIAGIPRAAMASFDFSMGLRQGGQVAVRRFPQWADAQKESAKYAIDGKYFEKEMKSIAKDDAFELIDSKMGIRLPAVYGESDEIMASAKILERIPVYGKGIEASDRAYSGGLTRLRYNLAKQVIDSYGGIDEMAKKLSDKEMRDLGEVINTSTGSGGKKGGFTERHMHTLATTLFAPRLWASRLNGINPAYYARLSGPARKMALENMGSFLAAAGAVAGMAAAAGAEVEIDPRSSDFMKVKVDNTRFDIMGGLQQNIVFFARMLTGEKINSSTGEVETLGDGFGKPNRFDLASDMLGNKLNPLLGYAKRLMERSADGTDKFGQEVNPVEEFANLFIPLGVQGLVDTYNDTGDVAKTLAMNVPSFFGIGVQTYSKEGEETKSKDPNAKIGDDILTDVDGKALLDADGKQVKLDFEDGATDLEKKALMDEKRRSVLKDNFKKKQSSEDQALMKLSEDELDEYLENGDIDQEKYDKIAELKQELDNMDVDGSDKDLKSDVAKRFYEKYSSLSESKKEEWLNAPASENSKKIAESLNKERVAGLSEFKPSQKLAKLYADYEKKINGTKNLSEIDKRNEAKKFQVAAAKLNYSEDITDVYNEGGSSDLKTLLQNKKVSKEQVDAAIQLDNELYASGLVGSLKFSKKFRNTFGYGVPSGPGGSGGGSGSGGSGGSGGGGKESYSQQLSSLASSTIDTKTSAMPRFSSARRAAPKPVAFQAPSDATPGEGNNTVSIDPYRTISVSQMRRSVAG